jgi:hypothetical protein
MGRCTGGNGEKKRAIGRLGCRWKDIFKLIFKEWDWGYGLD